MSLSVACNLKLLWTRRLSASRLWRAGNTALVHEMFSDVEAWVIKHSHLDMGVVQQLAWRALA